MLKKINELPETARIAIILLCLVMGAFCLYGAVMFSRVEDSHTISELKKALKEEESFIITAKNETEKKEIERVISEYNKKKRYEETDCYKMYKHEENEYLVVSERIWYREFNKEAGDFYMCLGDMTAGIRDEKGTFYFYYMNDEQEEYFIISMQLSLLAMEELDIRYQELEGEEVTIICITVEPKSNSNGTERMSCAPFY